MVNTRANNNRRDNIETSAAAGNRAGNQFKIPTGNPPVTVQLLFEQMRVIQERLDKTEQELVTVRAEMDALIQDRPVKTEERRNEEDDLKPRRKKEDNFSSKRKNDGSPSSNKKFKEISSKGKGDKKDTSWCSQCRSRHLGACSTATRRCDKCGRIGHKIKECKDQWRCFRCNSTDHKIPDCPAKKAEEKRVDRGGRQ